MLVLLLVWVFRGPLYVCFRVQEACVAHCVDMHFQLGWCALSILPCQEVPVEPVCVHVHVCVCLCVQI